jgi:hypothetical protein
MNRNELLRAFFEDLAGAEDTARAGARSLLEEDEVPIWVHDAEPVRVLRQALTSPEQVDAFSRVATDLVNIALHSALVAIDGGSASAEVGRVQLVDEAGENLGDGLHELYIDYLLETGRMA